MTYTTRFFLHAENTVSAFEKRLSICLQTNGFSFSILDKKNTLLTFADIEYSFTESLADVITGVKQIFSSLNVAVSGYNSVELIYPTAKSIWIPEHLFSAGHEKEYLQSVCEVLPSESSYSLFVEKVKAFSVSAFSNSLVSGIKIAIPSIITKSQHAKIVEFPYLRKNKSGVSIAVHIRETEVDIVVFDAEKFVFSNTFAFSEQEDILYYVLNVIKQLKYKESRVTLHFSGKISPPIFDRFREFFPHVKLERLDEIILPDEQFYSIPRHEYALILY